MAISRTIPSITFAVHDVEPANTRLETCKPMDTIRSLLSAESEMGRIDETGSFYAPSPRVEAVWNYSADCLPKMGSHPVIAAAHIAFSEHRPLVLSPDVIWVTIVQGLA